MISEQFPIERVEPEFLILRILLKICVMVAFREMQTVDFLSLM